MRTKTLGAWTAVVMTVIGLTVTGSALFTISQVGGIEKTWRNFENDASTKGTILNALRNDRGFTALVHNFTEYASSGKISDIEKIQKGITDTLGNLAAYRMIGVDETESAVLKSITRVVDLHSRKLALAQSMAREGKPPAEIVAAIKIDSTAAFDAIMDLEAALNEGRLTNAETVYRSVDQVTLLMKSALIISGIMLVVLVVGFFRFMKSRSERNQALRELSEKTAILEATLNNVDQGISFADTDLNLVTFNQRFLELLEFPLDRFKPGDPFEYFIRYNAERGEYGPGDIDAQVRERVDLASKFQTHHFERERPDGTVIEIRGNVLPDGQGFVTTYLDVTDRKRAEKKLLKANSDLEAQRQELKNMARMATEARDAALASNRSKSEFLANMSHELRTPLNAVIGFSDMMQNELMGPIGNPQYLSYAKDIHDSGEHLLGLINDILDLSKIEAGEMTICEETLDLGDAMKSSLKIVQPRADAGGVLIENLTPSGPLEFLGEPRKIKQILINLLSNAVKFTPEYGTVSVNTRLDEAGGYVITVSDSGIGIAPEDIEKVLQPFVQADSALSRKYEGTGLGLPLTKALIELHGGALELTSEQGVGTVATVRMPASRTVGVASASDLSGVA